MINAVVAGALLGDEHGEFLHVWLEGSAGCWMCCGSVGADLAPACSHHHLLTDAAAPAQMRRSSAGCELCPCSFAAHDTGMAEQPQQELCLAPIPQDRCVL